MAYRRAKPERWYWIKAVGSQEEPLPVDWPRSRGHLLRWVWFSKYPRSLRAGDLLAYYAAGRRVFPAIAELASDEVIRDPDHPVEPNRWVWKMAVRPRVVVPLDAAASLEEAGIEPKRLRRQSHVRLTGEEYGLLRRAFIERVQLETI